MRMLHRRRWAIAVTVFVCTFAVALWIIGRLSNRSLLPLEVIGVAGGVAAIVAAFSWARNSESAQNRASDPHKPNRGTTHNDPQRSGVTNVRMTEVTGRNSHLPNATSTSHRLRWCGKDEVLTAKSYLLREPMVYYSVSAPSDEEPSCVDLSLEVRLSGRLGEPAPSAYPTYAQLSPGQPLVPAMAFERPNLCDRTQRVRVLVFMWARTTSSAQREDRNEIVKEIIRLRATYASFRVIELHLNRLLSFALARFGFENFDSHVLKAAFEKPPPNCKLDDLAVACPGSASENSICRRHGPSQLLG